MAVNRAKIVDQNFIEACQSQHDIASGSQEFFPWDEQQLPRWTVMEIFDSMMSSRLMDIHARELKTLGQSFYTIGGSGHECSAAVAAACRYDDPAYLHYRSGGFFIQRANQLPNMSALYDILLGLVASSDEPIAGGRHKVFGSVPLFIPPQTSTIASHLPKAIGAAFTIARQRRLNINSSLQSDSIVLCSFGDASANHSTSCGAFNAASLADYQKLPCPILFICEDNGIGISVKTPTNWIEERFAPDVGLKYFCADGLDLFETYHVAKQAVDYVRKTRRPTILHLKVVRLLGHAGSDVEQLYRSLEEIEHLESKDPLIHNAKRLIELGITTPSEILHRYESIRNEIHRLGRIAVSRPKIMTAEEVIQPLAPIDAEKIKKRACTSPPIDKRKEFFGRLPEEERPRHLAMLINRTLGDILIDYPHAIVFGEDVGKKGGVYHVTADLQEKVGRGRVFNTHLDETSILGLAIGAGQWGMLPIPEIQYLAYLHNAVDQIRGEACSQQFFSQGQFSNPMVVRIAGLAYQKGFGGHFHNANAIASIRDIPGLIIACPSNGRDAALMLRTCVAAAEECKLVSIFLEPIALYMTKDLHEDKDGLWSFEYPSFEEHIPIGSAKTWTEGNDLTIFSYANGLWMSLRVAQKLQETHNISIRVVDLRWMNPLPEEDILREAQITGKVLIVDECRKTGGIAEGIMALISENTSNVTMRRINGSDTYIPLGAAANLVLIQESDIETAILKLHALNKG